MSLVAVRAALETALNAMTTKIATAWENDEFTPPADTVPYQAVNLLTARPVNQEMGRAYVESGFMQVTLRYPLKKGPAAATARAEALRATFYRGATFTASGVRTIIEQTPEIMPGFADQNRWAIPVRIRFYAEVYPA
jgi:hypothetical protein